MNCIEIKDLSFGYTNEKIIDGLNLTIEEGEFSVIRGDNGSGKSTLLKLLLGQLEKQKGSIKIMGKPIEKYNSFKDIGYLPQINSNNKISFPVTCEELVSLNLYESFGFIKIPRKKHKLKAREELRKIGMEKFIDRPFNELSGGQQQRIMIARAMVNNPKLLVLDEPTVGVDQKSKELFFHSLKTLNKEKGITVVIVTHEFDFVRDYIKKAYKIINGEIQNVEL